jgi:hypothetical protein
MILLTELPNPSLLLTPRRAWLRSAARPAAERQPLCRQSIDPSWSSVGERYRSIAECTLRSFFLSL